DPDGASGDRGRRRRQHGRGASESRRGVVRRRAVALSGPVCAVDAGSADYRGSHWAAGGGAGCGRSMKAGRLECWTVGMCLFLPTVQPSNLQTQDPWPSLDRATAPFDTVRTPTADFVQLVENPMLGDIDTPRGKLCQRRPNYFAM